MDCVVLLVMPKSSFNYANLGISLAVGIIVFVYGGYWLGKKLGYEQIGVVVGVVLGLAYTVYEIWKIIKT